MVVVMVVVMIGMEMVVVTYWYIINTSIYKTTLYSCY